MESSVLPKNPIRKQRIRKPEVEENKEEIPLTLSDEEAFLQINWLEKTEAVKIELNHEISSFEAAFDRYTVNADWRYKQLCVEIINNCFYLKRDIKVAYYLLKSVNQIQERLSIIENTRTFIISIETALERLCRAGVLNQSPFNELILKLAEIKNQLEKWNTYSLNRVLTLQSSETKYKEESNKT